MSLYSEIASLEVPTGLPGLVSRGRRHALIPPDDRAEDAHTTGAVRRWRGSWPTPRASWRRGGLEAERLTSSAPLQTPRQSSAAARHANTLGNSPSGPEVAVLRRKGGYVSFLHAHANLHRRLARSYLARSSLYRPPPRERRLTPSLSHAPLRLRCHTSSRASGLRFVGGFTSFFYARRSKHALRNTNKVRESRGVSAFVPSQQEK